MWPDRVQHFLEESERKEEEDWRSTNRLKGEVASFRRENPHKGLTRALFNRIVSWKLRDQIHRDSHNLQKLSDSMVQEVTGAAFRLAHPDLEVSSRVRTEVLTALPGVGLGIASAILAMYFPESFGIIDYRVWDEVHERPPTQDSTQSSFTIGNYMEYLACIRPVAQRLNVDVQLVDYALWRTWELRRTQ